jgi:hypothetical protein
MRTHLLLTMAILALFSSNTVLAETPEKPKSRVGLDCGNNAYYPFTGELNTEFTKYQEGWVDIRLTVENDESVTDVEIVNSFGNPNFSKAASDFIPKCKYVGIKDNSEFRLPLKNVPIRYYFSIRKNERETGASKQIYNQLKNAQDLTEAGDLDAAEAALDKVEGEVNTIYEIMHMLIRRSAIMIKREQTDLALRYLQTLSRSKDYIEPAEYAQLLRLRLGLELAQGLLVNAESTLTTLQAEKISLDGDPMLAGLNQLRAVAQSDQPMAVSGELPTACRPVICDPAKPSWSYKPVRRSVALTNVTGKLDEVSIRCDRRTFRTKAEADVSWTIPASWGTCSVSVAGEPGAKFTLIDENPAK